MQKLNILFFLSKARTNSNNEAPIFLRLTKNKERRQFSTGIFINEKYWDSKKQRAKGLSEIKEIINPKLAQLVTKILKLEQQLVTQNTDNTYTIDELVYKLRTTDQPHKTLIQVYDFHNERMKTLIGTEYSINTYRKFVENRNQLKTFINHQFKQNDISLSRLDFPFISDLEYYLKTERDLCQNSINKFIQRVRKIIKIAIGYKWIDKDPFYSYKPKKTTSNLVFLDENELRLLENYNFYNSTLARIRDIYIFSVYTGLAFNELCNLTHEHIFTSFDNQLWIKIVRQKTKKEIQIPLLPKAIQIIDKFKTNEKIKDTNKVFYMISNQHTNIYLHEIGNILGINKKLTFHTARKTYATTILLFNDVPIEIVSSLLGHSNISTTQKCYAKVMNQKISEKMIKLKEILQNKDKNESK